MGRRVGESIEVRVSGELSDAPMSFLWRNRLYVVREVLDHWRERRDWWATAAARAVHGDAGPVGAGSVGAAAVGSAALGSAVVSGGGETFGRGVRLAVHEEQEVWRVEASAGRIYGTGVYDLAREPSVRPSLGPGESAAGVPGRWQLVRMAD
jgi:hypothetical protein